MDVGEQKLKVRPVAITQLVLRFRYGVCYSRHFPFKTRSKCIPNIFKLARWSVKYDDTFQYEGLL